MSSKRHKTSHASSGIGRVYAELLETLKADRQDIAERVAAFEHRMSTAKERERDRIQALIEENHRLLTLRK